MEMNTNFKGTTMIEAQQVVSPLAAMKQALEALEANDKLINGEENCFGLEGAMDGYYRDCFDVEGVNKLTDQAIASLRQAIEQAEKQDGDCQQCGGKGCVACDAREQEPVAWMNAITKEIYWRNQINSDVPNVPLYTHPPKREWVGLTEQQRNDIEDQCEMIIGKPAFDAIDVKLKELNT